MNSQKHATSTYRTAVLLAILLLGTFALAPIDGADAAGGPDVTDPVVTGQVSRTILWRPTGGLFPVGLSASANDDCDGSIDVTVRIYSDETNAAIPFPAGPDAVGSASMPLRLRSERLYPGPAGNAGRCYVVSLSAMDTSGNTGLNCVGSICPTLPYGMAIMMANMELAAGVTLCAMNGGVIPPGMGWTELIPSYTLPPPIKAFPDAYDCIGNCRLTVPNGPSDVTANDTSIAGGITITTPGAFLSANGGDVVLAGDGSFTYDPPAGFEGADTFTYGIMDAAALTATGTVTITVDEVVWFIDNVGTLPSGGDGRQFTPFGSFTEYSTAADETGDIIYVDRGDGSTTDYDTGLTLLATQRLIGEGVDLATGAGLTVPPFNTLPGAGTRPDISNTTGAAIVCVGGNIVRGLNIDTTTVGSGIAASGSGLTCSDVVITAPGSDGMTFSSVSGTVDIDNVEVATPGGMGFNLSTCTGSFDFDGNCSVTSAGNLSTEYNLRVSGGTCDVTYNGGMTQAGPGGLVTVAGGHGTGLILFQTGTIGCTSGSGIRLGPCSNTNTFSTAMSLTTSTHAIVCVGASGTTNLTGLTIVSTGTGIDSNAGTLNVTGTNSIAATGGPALDLMTTTLGMTFSSITSTSSTGSGISLSSCAGSLAVTGLTDIDMSTGNAIISASSSSIDLDFATIDIDGGADGINIGGGVGDFDVSGATTIDGTSAQGIRIATSGAGDTFTFADTDVGLTTACASGVSLTTSSTATFTFADLDITTSAGAGLVADTAGTLAITAASTVNATGGAAIDITSTDAGGTGFTFASPVSTDSPDVGIRFDTTTEVITLTDVDIDSSSTMIDNGIEFTDCTGATKTVTRGHVIFTGTNDGNGILVDNSDNVTIEGDSTLGWDPIGVTPAFTPVLTGGFEITGMGTGSTLQVLNGNATGHHAVNCHDSNGLTVRRCNIHDIGDLLNADGHIDAGIFVDETTGGTVTVTSNYFTDIAGSPCLLLGDPSSLFTGTSTFDFTFNRVVGDPDEPNAGSMVHNIQNALQASFDSTTGATIVGNFDDNRIEGVSFTGIQVSVDLNVTNGDSGTGAGGRNLFSASDNYISDVDNEAVEFNVSDDSVSRIIVDDNTFDASNLHTAFDFGPQIAVDIQMNHGGATHTPILDLFIRNNMIESSNTGTQEWQDEGIRVETSSPSGAGVGVIRSLISDNIINHFDDSAIRIDVDETNEINTIIRDNDIDSSLATPSSTTGIIDLDDQSTSDQETMRAWIDGNDTGAPLSGVGYRIEEFEQGIGNPPPELACESPCTGLTVPSTITTNADLATLLNNNGNTANNGAAVTTADVDTSAGDVLVVTTASIPAPTMLASARAQKRIGTYLADKIPAQKLLEIAKQRWLDAGISNQDASLLRSISLEITDLPGQALGKTWITHIMLDPTAAGHGWFIDRTPEDDKEFSKTLKATKDGGAKGCMDLLTVLMHEIGHVLGREHCSCGKHLMSHKLEPGVRHNPVK